MGAIQSTNSATVFLSISDGKVCRRVPNQTSSSVMRTTKDNRIVHEEFYNGWLGKITDIKTRETDYGKEWNVTLDDGTVKAVLQFKYSSGYAASFLKALPNVELNQPVTISPKLTIDGDKKRTTLFVNQNGSAVKWAYTKENPNGCPGLKQIKVKGQTTWDDSEMMEFLEQMVQSEILPKLDDSTPF